MGSTESGYRAPGGWGRLGSPGGRRRTATRRKERPVQGNDQQHEEGDEEPRRCPEQPAGGRDDEEAGGPGQKHPGQVPRDRIPLHHHQNADGEERNRGESSHDNGEERSAPEELARASHGRQAAGPLEGSGLAEEADHRVVQPLREHGADPGHDCDDGGAVMLPVEQQDGFVGQEPHEELGRERIEEEDRQARALPYRRDREPDAEDGQDERGLGDDDGGSHEHWKPLRGGPPPTQAPTRSRSARAKPPIISPQIVTYRGTNAFRRRSISGWSTGLSLNLPRGREGKKKVL